MTDDSSRLGCIVSERVPLPWGTRLRSSSPRSREREMLGVLSALNTRELRNYMLKAGFDRGESLSLSS